jgi:glycosidase
MMEFHISRNARERYKFAESLFSYTGNVIFANVTACREFAHRMNQVRDVEKHPELAVHAGKLYAMGLIDEASHVLMARYREQFDPAVMTSALDFFSAKVGAEALDTLLLTFVEQFPGITVIRGEETPLQWLAGTTDGTPHRAAALEELLLLWTANRNEAFRPFEELFEEKPLAEKTVYRQIAGQFPEYFATRPLIPLPNAKSMNLLDLLRAPAMGAPGSLADQLALIRKMWKPLLGDSLEHFLLIAGEILHEEELAIWMQFNPPDVTAQRRRESGKQQWPAAASSAQVPEFGDAAHEYEKFSPDTAWMPTAVLIAKSTYVWLAQMSKQYGRRIARLDEIPDEELATLARRGLNSLWLIGIWERSRASKTIKQLCGNTDAVASAYSLYDYKIAAELGGEAAYVNLRDRAFHHGIRLASDMVPNHMGIDSPWVVEHPDWFISRPEPPYPAYSFNGPDLSQDGRVEIKIEDHYFEQSDAAVVFRRRDRASGETRFIYHGNDGTSFPWNDTAQLDYLNAAVREQVIQTILHVARLFPVIRFDAAMTLAKRHFHRLWFPGPGASGAIPSRAEYGMSQEAFDRAMPHEFWREVVDRVAAEVPGTLLLAEAFWLMEGYFVRTLGMHRVYNSAFMVMLRDEDNAKYRSVIKNTLEFDPDIMKRYVNFMSNPDERTAIDQFGKGDKCFGVSVMMATLPGLPMFGHGQIEGFTEKYGMEYQRPRYDESPDHWMVQRHEREIAPLLKRRRLFAESSNFLLYDFFLDSGKVDENVFAYSNRNGNERALIVYNNHYGETRGTIDYSAAYADKSSGQLRQQRLREGLGLTDNSPAILAWRDSLTGLKYLRRASDLAEHGLTFNLRAYQCNVYLEWREMYATVEQPWDRLCDQLNGRGVPDLEDALVNLELQPVHDALRAQLDSGIVRLFADLAEHPRTLAVGINNQIETERTDFFDQAWERCESFLCLAQKGYLSRAGVSGIQPANPGLLRTAFRERLRAAMRIPAVESLFPEPWSVTARRVLPSPSPQLTATSMWGPVLGWCVLELLAESIDPENPEGFALDLFDRLRLREPFAQAFNALGFDGDEGWRVAARIKVLLLARARVGKPEKASSAPAPAEAASSTDEQITLSRALWRDPDVRWLTGVHEAEGHSYLVRESYEELLWWLLMPSLLRLAGEACPSRAAAEEMSRTIEDALGTAEAAGYRVDLLLAPSATEPAAGEPVSEADSGTQQATESAAGSEAESEVFAEAQPLSPEPSEPIERDEPAEPKTDPVAESEVEPAAEFKSEPEVEPEAPANAEPLSPGPSEPAEPEIDPVVEPEAEVAAEPEIEPETVAEARPLSIEPSEPAEPETDPAAGPEAECSVESPAVPEIEAGISVEAQPLSTGPSEPTEPEIEPYVESEAEPAAEFKSEPEDEPEAPADVRLLAIESSEPAGPEIDSVAELQPETVAEAEASAEAQSPSAELSERAELKTDPVIEPEAESDIESPAEPETDPEASAEAEVLPIEPSEPTETEIDPLAEFRIEPAEESASEAEVELEASVKALLLSIEPIEPRELEIDPLAEFRIEPAEESTSEPEVEPEASVEVLPSSPEPSKSAEPEIDLAAEPETEAEVEHEASADVLPLCPESGERAEPEDHPLAKPEVDCAMEYPVGPLSDPEALAEAQPLPAGPHEPKNPVINSRVEYVAQPKTESEAFVGWRFLSSEPWEPPAPKIEFAAKGDAEVKAADESRRMPAGQWEPAAPKIANHSAELKAVTEAQHLSTEPWEPPAPKIEFSAKPANGVEDARPAPVEPQKRAEQEIEPPAHTPGDSGNPA